MRVLALDTALGACSVAFAVDGRIQGHCFEHLGHGHAERLLPMVEEARRAAGLDYRELDLIAVTVGPGTFTGVRIGLAAARALALPHATPVAGVGTLQAIAWGAGAGTPVLAAIDARRSEFYVQAFSATLAPDGAPRVATAADIVTLAKAGPGPWRLVGSGGAALQPLLAAAEPADAPDEPDAATIALQAAALAPLATPGQPPAPVYLRAPDARLPGKAPAA